MRDLMQDGFIKFKVCKSKDQLIDIFTKPSMKD